MFYTVNKGMKMKTKKATFSFEDAKLGTIRVTFFHKKDGTSDKVSLVCNSQSCEVQNPFGRWKPCVTHCKDLIDLNLKGRLERLANIAKGVKRTTIRFADGTWVEG